MMHKSDANRGLAEECGLTLPTIRILGAVDSEFVLMQVRVYVLGILSIPRTSSRRFFRGLVKRNDTVILLREDSANASLSIDAITCNSLRLLNIASVGYKTIFIGGVDTWCYVCRVIWFRCSLGVNPLVASHIDHVSAFPSLLTLFSL